MLLKLSPLPSEKAPKWLEARKQFICPEDGAALVPVNSSKLPAVRGLLCLKQKLLYLRGADKSFHGPASLSPVTRERLMKQLTPLTKAGGIYPGIFDSLILMGPEAAPQLLAIYRSTKSPKLRFLLMPAIGAVGNKTVIPGLLSLFNQAQEARQRWPIAQALARLGHGSPLRKLTAEKVARIERELSAEKDLRIRNYLLARAAHLWHGIKQYDKALVYYRKLERLGYPHASLAAYNIACAHAMRGRKDQAFKALERSLEGALDVSVKLLEIDRELSSLRGDPRWKALMKRYRK